MSNPSLLCVPYRFKTSKLYSQIPDSGLGDFVVTRSASNSATRVNAAGLIETVADNVPRLDYPLGGISAGCPALLVEPSAQNLALQSAGFSVSATWVPEGTPNPTQVTANTTATLDPAGGNTADIITLVSGNANQLRQSFVSTSGTTYTVSVFLKNIALTSGQTFLFSTTNQEATVNQVNCTIDLANLTIAAVTVGTGVTVSNAALDNYGNGWYRARFTFSFAVGGSNSYIRLRQPSVVLTNYAFYAWGAQLEVGSVATSYIPTAASPVTRGAETISKTGVSSLIGQTEGTIYMEVEQDPVNRDIFSLNTGTGNSIIFYKNSSNIVNARLYANSSTIFTLANAVATNGFVKIALAYKAGDSAMVVNAGTAQTSASSFTFASPLSLVSLTPSWFTNAGFTKIRALELYPTRLPNTGPLSLQSLTQ